MSMITISGAIETTHIPSQAGGEGAGVSLKIGEQLEAKVLRIDTNQRVLMDFGRFRASVHIEGPVKLGRILQLKVVDIGFPVHMQIMSDRSVADRWPVPSINIARSLTMAEQQALNQITDQMMGSKAMAPALLDHQHLRQALMDLRDLKRPLALDGTLKEVAACLQRTIDNRSLFFEKKLAQWLAAVSKESGSNPSQAGDGDAADEVSENAGRVGVLGRMLQDQSPWHQLLKTRDLKAQLLFFKSLISELAPGAASKYGIKAGHLSIAHKVIDNLLAHLEQQQERLVQRSPQSHSYQVIVHQLPIKNQIQPLKLKLYYPKRNRSQSEKPPQYVCLLLDMDRLGPVRADLRLSGRQLQLTFSVASQGIQQVFESELDKIVPALETFFQAVETMVQVSAEKIAEFDKEEMTALEPGRIDIQA